MRQITALFAFFLVFSVAALAQPKLEIVGGDTYDWGDVKPKDNPLKAKVMIKNAGDELLKIEKVKPTCGCTTAPLSKDELSPGETAELDITLRIGSRPGSLSKSIRIMSNDSENETKYLRLKANVVYPLVTKPTYVKFDDLQVGQESMQTISLENKSPKPITITDVVTDDNTTVNIQSGKKLMPGEQFTVIVRVTPTREGNMSVNIKLKTDCQDMDELTLKGFGKVDPSPVFENQ